ncbi:MAG TPA: methylamine dehydrogenase accessory protein MauD [Burkholderiaceae bacterium]|nr:methylamine dehydrogenase accessory protein MauD [Burkholderiaceae bacterium]
MNALLISNIVLWMLVLALMLAVWALARQIGVLYERIAPMGALVTDAGPRLGEAAPQVTAPTLTGEPLTIGGRAAHGTLLFFLSPTCPVCKKLLPALRSIADAEAGWLRIVLASDGNMPEHLAFRREAGLERFPYVLSGELGMTYRVSRLPYAVLIDESGQLRAKGMVNTREHLESLFTAKELGVGTVQQYLDVQRQPA